MMRFGITPRLWLAMLLMAVLPLVALQQALENHFGDAMRTTITGHLQAVTLIKMAQIDGYIAHMQENAQALAQTPGAKQALKELAAAPRNAKRFRQLRQQYLDIADSVADPLNFYDLLLVASSGEVVLTRREEPDMGTNLLAGPYRDTLLARAVRETQQSLRVGFFGYEHYPPSRAQAAFIAAPVMEGDRLLGTLVLQISLDSLVMLVNDYAGLGETGEVVVAQRAGNDAVIVAPLRTSREKPPLKVFRGSNVALFAALDKEKGVGIRLDYRGEEVLAAWSFLPRTQWGVVVKIDTAEAFRPIRQMRQWGSALLLGIILLVGAVAWWLGRSIVRPIKTLTRLSGEIAAGDLDKRIPPIRSTTSWAI